MISTISRLAHNEIVNVLIEAYLYPCSVNSSSLISIQPKWSKKITHENSHAENFFIPFAQNTFHAIKG